MSKSRSSVYYSPEQGERLEQIAADLGLYHTRGPGKRLKLGSISRLIQAIADGEVLVVKAPEQPQEGDQD